MVQLLSEILQEHHSAGLPTLFLSSMTVSCYELCVPEEINTESSVGESRNGAVMGREGEVEQWLGRERILCGAVVAWEWELNPKKESCCEKFLPPPFFFSSFSVGAVEELM